MVSQWVSLLDVSSSLYWSRPKKQEIPTILLKTFKLPTKKQEIPTILLKTFKLRTHLAV